MNKKEKDPPGIDPRLTDQYSSDRHEDKIDIALLSFALVGLLFIIAVIFLLSFLLSNNNNEPVNPEQFNPGQAETSQPTNQTTAQGQMKVALGEWFVRPESSRLKAGQVKFALTNQGQSEHEFIIVKSNKRAADLGQPLSGQIIAEQPSISFNSKSSLTTKLSQGHYALVCDLPGHYQAGMHADLNVVK